MEGTSASELGKLARAVVLSAETNGDAALQALALVLAQRIEAESDPVAVDKLAGRLLDCLRELGWTPHTRAGDDDDDFHEHRELGSSTLRNVSQPRGTQLGA